MNSLAIASDGVLVERSFMRQHGLRVGDALQVRLNAASNCYGTPMRIVGDFRYFPTWYSPEAEGRPLLVANLDWVFEQTGGERPYDVWIRTTPTVDFEQMVTDLREYEISVLDYQACRFASPKALADTPGIVWRALGRLSGVGAADGAGLCSMRSSRFAGALSS